MQLAKFDQLGIIKMHKKQEIIDVIAKHEKAYYLGIKSCITQLGMNIALRERITNYVEIEIIYIMIDASYKCVVNNTNIKIQECPVCNSGCYPPVIRFCRVYISKCHQTTSHLLCKYHLSIYNCTQVCQCILSFTKLHHYMSQTNL